MLQSNRLHLEAQRCFRLARGIANAKLSDELEAMGRAFEREAEELEAIAREFEYEAGALEGRRARFA